MNILALFVVLLFVQCAFCVTLRREPVKFSFGDCCDQGSISANVSNTCDDYLGLYDKSAGCKAAYTVCCTQTKSTAECVKGQAHASSGKSCTDLKSNNVCASLSDCCNCCELGIQTRKSEKTGNCKPLPGLNNECRGVFIDCCKSAPSYDDCTQHYCPNGQVCENTRTGPICSCPSGYEKDARSNHCIDIDECKRPFVCQVGSTCQNTAGSYTCTKSCGVGYNFDAIFIQCRDLNECATGNHNCASGMRCENYPGSFRCIREISCGTGYSVNAYTQECDDVDECSLNLHDCSKGFICYNLPGTFKCKPKECAHGHLFNYNTGDCEQIVCLKGYEIDASGRCVDIDECKVSDSSVCYFNEKCENTIGSYKCVLVLICEKGFELNEDKTQCIDINECKVDRHTCPQDATCVNTQGSYSCECPSGYKLDSTRNRCDDIDECAFGKVCPSNSVCRNTPGSFICDCKSGFTLQSHIFYTCVDVDECAQVPSVCDHKCVNTYGSYQCTCKEGYKLASDKRSCQDVDECALQSNICPQGICTNTPGSYECSCAVGFTLDSANYCTDIDECESSKDNCGQSDQCLNIRGSFKCIRMQCPDGYNLIADIKNTNRCDRTNAICKYGDSACLREPMKIFYSHTSFSYMVPMPLRIFTTRVNVYSRRILLKYDFKVTDSSGQQLREDQFMVRQTDDRTFDVYLLERCKANDDFNLDLKIEFYQDERFSSCLLNKIHVYVTD